MKHLLTTHVHWLDDAKIVLREQGFIAMLEPSTTYAQACISDQLDMITELITKLLHYIGRSLGNTSLSIGNLAGRPLSV